MKRPVSLLVSLVVLGSLGVPPRCVAAESRPATIYRDEFGIPHIFADTLEDAAYAVGYAQAEDRLEELLKNYRRARGTMAEVFGPDSFQDDVRQHLMRHAEISQARYGEVSAKMRGVIQSFQAGIKQFMTDHPEQVPAWAPRIEPWDVVALGRYIIWNWPIGEAAGDLKRAGVDFGPLAYRGSNEMLIAPKRTSMNATIAIVDPHVQWYDAMRFYEVRVYSPELSVAGVAILGVPLPTLGHSRYCSVAMTTGGPDTSDIFEEEVNPSNPDQYRYDGNWRNFSARKLTINVKKAGQIEPRQVTLVASHHGPIVARRNGKAYAMALPYENEVGLTDQCYQMMKARNLAEMKQALSHLQLMAQNIMVGTVQGDTFYIRNGRVPIRPKGVDPGRPIAGNTSATEWKGIHPMSDLVQIENPACGWMQNCNCSPSAMMKQGQPRPEQFAERADLFNAPAARATHQRAEMVNDLLDATTNVTVEKAVGIAFSTQVWHAELWQARLKEAWHGAPAAARSSDTQRVYELIQEWNARSDPDSQGALAFYAFKKALPGEEARKTEPGSSLTDRDVQDAVRKGAAWLTTNFGAVAIPFGDYFRVGRRGGGRSWPVGGGSLQDVAMATPRAVSFGPSPDGKQMIGHSGQSSTQVVILTDPPESYAVIPLGESDHKESGPWDDQAEKLFSKGKVAQTYFMRPDELMKHVKSKKVLSPPRPQ
jgi:acyl-homoserine lactone acylase PvdQ